MPTLNDVRQSLMAKVACRKNVYKINGLLVKKEEERTGGLSDDGQSKCLFRIFFSILVTYVRRTPFEEKIKPENMIKKKTQREIVSTRMPF